MFMAIFGAAAVFCGVWALYFQLIVLKEKRITMERVENWIYSSNKQLSWSDALADKLDQTNWAKKLAPQLERASVRLRPAEYGVVLVAVGIGFAFFLYFGLGAHLVLSVGAGLSLTPFASKLFLKSRRNVYASKIDAQLSEACRLLSSAAQAGLSVPQGLEIVVKEMPTPIRGELGTVVQEIKLGRDLESALTDLLNRVSSRDLQVFVNALIIQRRVGGNLARVLSEMARTMEERKLIQQTIKAYTSQSRYTAYTLPLASLLVVFVMSKMVDGFELLFQNIFGYFVLMIFVTLQLLGIIIVRKISNIRV
ncbi:tight adherence protein B [Melghirimyces profundicolus]|uniref:Tight adherence protein B n=1 Tax=Melghirimyces profundicolus TaxID=1242148 RepID=A0A2T6BGS8_9BACL|nr:type II secretion system F family protein [Melghirimyces profundicolus]PTX55273.1 tight adherence protein B [Melghirimyces profundicolus]